MSEKTEIDDFYDLADQHMREGRYAEAIELYLKLSQANPEEESIVMSLAWAYRDSGRVPEAISCLEALLEKELGRRIFTGFAFDELVRIYRESGDYGRMVAICEKVVAMQPDDVALLTTLGDAYLNSGQPDKAVEVFSRLTEMEPEAPVLFCRLGDACAASGNFDGAENAYGRAVYIDPSDAQRFYNNLGNVFFKAGQSERAEKSLGRSLALCPDQPLVRCSLGEILIGQGRVDEAAREYEEAARIDRASSGGYYNRMGNILAGKHYNVQAVDAFEKAVESDPRNPFYCLNLVKACEAAGFYDKAKAAYEKARSLGVFS